MRALRITAPIALLAALVIPPGTALRADVPESILTVSLEIETHARDLAVSARLLEAYEQLEEEDLAKQCRERMSMLIEKQREALSRLQERLDDPPEPLVPPRPPRPKWKSPTASEEDAALLSSIAEFRAGLTPIHDYPSLVEMLANPRRAHEIRAAAAAALASRIGNQMPSARTTEMKKKIGKELIWLLNDRDPVVRRAAAGLFKAFWPGTWAQIGYDPEESDFRIRYKRCRDWRSFLGR